METILGPTLGFGMQHYITNEVMISCYRHIKLIKVFTLLKKSKNKNGKGF